MTARTKRQKSVEALLERAESKAASAISQVAQAVADLKILVPAMHNDILNKGESDFSEANRHDLAITLDPALLELTGYMQELQELGLIFNDDPATYQANLDQYLIDNPDVLDEYEGLLG